MLTTTDDLKAKANAAYSKKDWREAVRLFAEVVEHEQDGPAKATVLAKRSAAYVKLEDYSSALADAELAVEADPSAALAQVRIAEAALKLKEFEKAEKAYVHAGELATDTSSRKRYKEAVKSVQRAARHEATTQEKSAPPPSSAASGSSTARKANRRSAPRARGTRPSISASLPSRTDHDFTVTSETWRDRLIHSMTNDGFQYQPEGGIGVALAAWNQCELGLQHLHRTVYMVPAGLHVDLFNPDCLTMFCDCILSTELGFHLSPSPNPGDLPTLTKLRKLIEAEADKGDFCKYLTDSKWTPQQIVQDLNKRIPGEGRQLIRRFTASLINGRIIGGFFCHYAKKPKQAVVSYRLALDVLEEGNRQWAHESQGTRGNVFSPTVVRGVKVVLMKALMRGHQQAKTDEERRDFPLDEIEELADSLLEDELPESYYTRQAAIFRTGFQLLPRWEAYAGLAYASAYRAEEPFRNQQPGVPVIVNLELARQANDWYDAAASAMPFDWHQKRDILWAGLRLRLLTGGSTIKEVRERAAEAKRVDDFATRFFGPLPAKHEPRDFVDLQAQACEQWLRTASPHHSPNSILKPIPRIHCPPGFDSSTVLTKEFWEAPHMEGEILSGLPYGVKFVQPEVFPLFLDILAWTKEGIAFLAVTKEHGGRAQGRGQRCLVQQNWNKAIDCWTKAIKKEKDAVALASLYSNRSAAYLKVSKYDAALRDAEQAVLKRPTWSKAKARMAEVYARQQIFDLAKSSYERAIELAEDDATRERYQASLKTTKEAEEKAKSQNQGPRAASRPVAEMQQRLFVNRVALAVVNGTYVVRQAGGMALSLYSYRALQMGMKDLQEDIRKIPGTDQFKINPDSHALSLIRIQPSQIITLTKAELQQGGCLKYFTNAIWAPQDMIADLNSRIATEGRQHIRKATSSLIHERIVSAGVLRFNPQGVASAVHDLKLAIALLDEGNRVWSNERFADRGSTFKPTFVRNARVLLMQTLVLATRDMKTAAAKRAYKPEDVEEIANRVIREHPPEDWHPRDGSTMRVCYSAYPVWEAYLARGYVWGIRAGVPLLEVQPRKYAFADLTAAKNAAEAYDKAAAILEDEAPDFTRYCFVLWYAIHWRLRAGGLSVRKLRSRVNKAKEATEETKRFVDDIEDSFRDIRKFCKQQLKILNESLPSAPPGITDRNTIKPIPTLNCKGLPRSFNTASLNDQQEFGRLPGDIGCIDQRG
ncbi:hypothetical protein NBRC10512v2_001088 [Rhodotorula toruloides]